MNRIAILLLLIALLGSHAHSQSNKRTLTCVVGDCKFEMVYVKGGSFIMGCEPAYWTIGKNDEVPLHGVILKRKKIW